MHVRIYFVVIIFSIVIACFKDDKLKSLSRENAALRESLRVHYKPAALRVENLVFDPFRLYRGNSGASDHAKIFAREHDPRRTIGLYAKTSREATLDIRNALTRSRHEAEAYLMMIDALKSEINIKDTELRGLRDDIVTYQSEMGVLVDSLTKKEQALEKILAMISDRQNGPELQKKVYDLSNNLRMAEAESCYAAAQRAEGAAHKILLAPARKKQSLLEALEGYKKAFSLGKEEAAESIARLQKSLYPAFAAK